MPQDNEKLFFENLKKNLEKNTNQINPKKDNLNEKNEENTENKTGNNNINAFEKLKNLTKNNYEKKTYANSENEQKNYYQFDNNEKKIDDKKLEKNSYETEKKIISYKENSNEEELPKKTITENEYENDYFQEIVPMKENSLIKVDEFEWEKTDHIEQPKQEDFNLDNNQRLGWLKKEIDKEQYQDKIKKEKNESFFPWESTQKISAPTREDFISEITQEREYQNKSGENFSNELIEFEWEKTNPIEQPKQEDFENKNFDEEKIQKTPKWKHNTTNTNQTTNTQTTPKWKHNTTNTNQTNNTQINETSDENFHSKNKIITPIDTIFELLEKYKIINMNQAIISTGINFYDLEKIMKTFEDYGIVSIEYPTSLSKKPNIVLLQKIESKMREVSEGKVIEKYEVEVDNVLAQIEIISTKSEPRPIYKITMPKIGTYTKKFLNFIKNEIAETIPIEMEEILDPKKSKKLKERFFEESQKQLKEYFKTTDKNILSVLSGIVLHEMYGLGDIEIFLGDDMLEEVAINSSKTPLTVYHRVHGWIKTNFYPGTEEEISNYSAQIGRKVGREITTLSPILDAHLLSGDRVNATLFPISSEGNTITIRRFARKPWTLIDFIGKAHTMNTEMAALLWLAMQYEMNIIVSGGTASGKTSTLNTLLALVPPYHRIISIEDVREIVLPKFLKWNWVSMVTRSANPEGLGEVTMLDCMVSSLRMRPDRIIVGEIRRKKEAEVMMEAIETGHSIYSTIHANSAYQVLRRLGEAPMSIPPMQIELIDLVVTQFRDRKTNKRRTYEIAEIEQTSSGKGLQINTIYKWAPRTDTWENLNKPNKILTLLNLHTGLTEGEIEKDLKEREKILNWLVDKKINELNEIGYIIKRYYIDKNEVLKMADKQLSENDIKEMMR